MPAVVSQRIASGLLIESIVMTEQEIAHLGSQYKAEVVRVFGFLVDELGFQGPIDVSAEYRHSLAYRCASRKLAVVFANAFHPVDYGFEIALYPMDGPWHANDRRVIFHALKEDQDPEMRFLSLGVPALRRALADVHGG